MTPEAEIIFNSVLLIKKLRFREVFSLLRQRWDWGTDSFGSRFAVFCHLFIPG